jgi:hypothetical protein
MEYYYLNVTKNSVSTTFRQSVEKIAGEKCLASHSTKDKQKIIFGYDTKAERDSAFKILKAGMKNVKIGLGQGN